MRVTQINVNSAPGKQPTTHCRKEISKYRRQFAIENK